jgi:drug/metabolite transporter (DMT)-like permease
VRPADFINMLLLGAIWGGAFPLLRVASPAFGPAALIGVRVGLAAAMLLPLLPQRRPILQLAGPYFVLGLINTAIPFTLFSFATLSIDAGLASLLNATTPMFGAVIAFFWLRERLSVWRVLGIAIGFAGIGTIVATQSGAGTGGAPLGIAAGLAAAALYGLAASYTRRRLRDRPPLEIAAGSVCGAAVAMLPLSLLSWPEQAPAPGAWLSALALGAFCTALAYVLYFRLLGNVGSSRAVTVTFLIPMFGILWGSLFLGERITPSLLGGCAIVLLGTALATGVIGPRAASARP